MVRSICVAALGMWLVSSEASAVILYDPVPIGGNTYVTGKGVMLPSEVFGKEYSHSTDEGIGGVADPEQVISWDGKGGTTNGFDFDDVAGNHPRLSEVDALANHNDYLHESLKRDFAHLLFSHDDTIFGSSTGWGAHVPSVGPITLPSGAMIGGAGEISIEESGFYNGVEIQTLWAKDTEVNGMPRPVDVDGLEVWGPEPPAGGGPPPVGDANRYSLEHDVGAGMGTSVWRFDPGTGLSDTYIDHATIVAAVEAAMMEAVPGGAMNRLDQQGRNAVNLDAMMIFDGDGKPDSFEGEGDSIIFSINQMVNTADADGYYVTGSELFVLEATAAGFAASFLDHGGHLWSHSYTLGAMKFTDPAGVENGILDINAIEAIGETVVPEPGSLAILTLGLVAIVGGCRSRSRA